MPARNSQPANSGIVYKADTAWIDNAKKTRQKLAGICGQHLNRPVRIQTIDGHTYEGTIVGTDGCHVHLMTRTAPVGGSGANGEYRFFGPFASSAAITTLVLYELLVITLLI